MWGHAWRSARRNECLLRYATVASTKHASGKVGVDEIGVHQPSEKLDEREAGLEYCYQSVKLKLQCLLGDWLRRTPGVSEIASNKLLCACSVRYIMTYLWWKCDVVRDKLHCQCQCYVAISARGVVCCGVCQACHSNFAHTPQIRSHFRSPKKHIPVNV